VRISCAILSRCSKYSTTTGSFLKKSGANSVGALTDRSGPGADEPKRANQSKRTQKKAKKKKNRFTDLSSDALTKWF